MPRDHQLELPESTNLTIFDRHPCFSSHRQPCSHSFIYPRTKHCPKKTTTLRLLSLATFSPRGALKRKCSILSFLDDHRQPDNRSMRTTMAIMMMMTNTTAVMIQSILTKVLTPGLKQGSPAHPEMPGVRSRDNRGQVQLNEESMEVWEGKQPRDSLPEVLQLLYMLSSSPFRNGARGSRP